MEMDRHAQRGQLAAYHAVNTMIVTVGSLYVATHSIEVTVAGSVAATVLSGWAMWLRRRPESDRPGAGDE